MYTPKTIKSKSGQVVIGPVFTNFKRRGATVTVKTEDLKSSHLALDKLVTLLVTEMLIDFDMAKELINVALKEVN